MKYTVHVAGKGGWSDWISPKRSRYRQGCCDCGLVHEMQFRLSKGKKGETGGPFIEYRAKRHERATGQVRRAMKAAA